MAVYEHLRKYTVTDANKTSAVLSGPPRRAYWQRFLNQSLAASLFKRALVVGDKVTFKRVSNRHTTFYVPVKLSK